MLLIMMFAFGSSAEMESLVTFANDECFLLKACTAVPSEIASGQRNENWNNLNAKEAQVCMKRVQNTYQVLCGTWCWLKHDLFFSHWRLRDLNVAQYKIICGRTAEWRSPFSTVSKPESKAVNLDSYLGKFQIADKISGLCLVYLLRANLSIVERIWSDGHGKWKICLWKVSEKTGQIIWKPFNLSTPTFFRESFRLYCPLKSSFGGWAYYEGNKYCLARCRIWFPFSLFRFRSRFPENIIHTSNIRINFCNVEYKLDYQPLFGKGARAPSEERRKTSVRGILNGASRRWTIWLLRVGWVT